MEETIIHTFQLSELNQLPEIFASLEELYIMLLDLVYTKKYNCIQQYNSIIQYCIENNFLINIQYQAQKFNNQMTPNQLIIGCLVIIPTLISNTNFQEAITLADALLNDITTQIQDYHLDSYFKSKYTVYLQLLKIFKNKISNQKIYIDIINILRSVAYEGLGNYKASLGQIQQIAETDKSIQLACLRIKFNLIYQQNKDFSVPMFEMAKNNINNMIQEIKTMQQHFTQKTAKNTLFDYDQSLIQYVSTLYLSRLNTLINNYEQANIHYTELWQLSPDDESYEESIVAYLDNFVRYSCGDRNDCSLVTKSPLFYHFHSQKVRLEVVNQALQLAIEFSQVKDKPQLNAIAFYYMGHLKIMLKDFDGAVADLRKSKELNQTQYKYPSELVSVAWLPSMIDFDLLSVMLLSGRKEICQVNQPNYFEKILQNKNILVQLSPDRFEMAQILHILFNFQRKFHDNSLLSNEDVVQFLVKVGMIDDKFCSHNTEFYYVEPSQYNCHLMVQVYILGIYFLQGVNFEVCQFMNDKIKDLVVEFPELQLVSELVRKFNSQQNNSQVQQEEQPSQPSFQSLLIPTQKRKTYTDNIQRWITKQTPPTTLSRRIQIYLKALQNSPESAFGMANLLPDDDMLKVLLKVYKNQSVNDILAKSTDSSFIIVKGMIMHENNQTLQAIELLEKTVYLTQLKENQQLVYFNLSKLHVMNSQLEDAINILQVLETTIDKSSQLYLSVITDLILIFEKNQDVHRALQLAQDNTQFNQLKTLVILKQFQFGIDYETLENLMQNYATISEFDSLILRFTLELPTLQDTPDYFKTLHSELTSRFSQFEKIFEQPKTFVPSTNYFSLISIDSQISPALHHQFSPISLFFSDLFSKKLSFAFFINLLILCSELLNYELENTIFDSFLSSVGTKYEISLVNNIFVYLMKSGKFEAAKSFLEAQTQQFNFQTFITSSQHQLCENQKIKEVEIQFESQILKLNFTVPNFPIELPEIYSKTEFFNPINQFTLESLIPQIPPPTEKSTNPQNDVLNSVFLLDYTAEITQKPVHQNAPEPNKLTLQQLEAPQKPIRAKSARPLLKIPKGLQQPQKIVVGKPIRSGFRRLKAIVDSGVEGDKKGEM